jgi:hypothetical protein
MSASGRAPARRLHSPGRDSAARPLADYRVLSNALVEMRRISGVYALSHAARDARK